MTISSLIIFLSILFALVVVHELGHFVSAKYFKMKVEEFAFGFPPSLLSKKIGETLYSINLIPLGGYVKILGENGLTEEEIARLTDKEREQLFGNKEWWQRIIVLSGGVLFNILGAFILFVVIFMIGSNVFLEKDEIQNIPNEKRQTIVTNIDPKSPLVGTGMEPGDEILSLQTSTETLSPEKLDSFTATEFVQRNNNSLINISFKKLNQKSDTEIYSAEVVPKAGIVEGKKVIGLSFSESTYKKYSFFEAIPEAFKTTFEHLKLIFSSLGNLIYNLIFKNAKVEDNLSGPVGLAMMTSKVSERGLDQILAFAALLSLSLAAFNILPIPALDGGRIAFVLYESIKGKKVNPNTEQLFHGIGFLALIALMVFVTYFDILKVFV